MIFTLLYPFKSLQLSCHVLSKLIILLLISCTNSDDDYDVFGLHKISSEASKFLCC